MNQNDILILSNTISYLNIEEENDCTQNENEVCFFLEKDENYLKYKELLNDPSSIPKEEWNFDLCCLFLNDKGEKLNLIPEECITEELCLYLVQVEPMNLFYIPYKFQTYDVCLQAVENNPLVLAFICKEAYENLWKDKEKLYDLLLNAVKIDGNALYHFPNDWIPWEEIEHEKKIELCIQAVQQKGVSVRYLPPWFFNEPKEIQNKVYLEAVKKDGLSLRYIPKNYRTLELYLDSVKENGLALEFVDEEMNEEEYYQICRVAYERNENAYEFMKLKSAEMMCYFLNKRQEKMTKLKNLEKYKASFYKR